LSMEFRTAPRKPPENQGAQPGSSPLCILVLTASGAAGVVPAENAIRGRTGWVLVLMEDAAEAVMSVDVQLGEPAGSVIGVGSAASGWAFVMPGSSR
jgi:hypothetical protein